MILQDSTRYEEPQARWPDKFDNLGYDKSNHFSAVSTCSIGVPNCSQMIGHALGFILEITQVPAIVTVLCDRVGQLCIPF